VFELPPTRGLASAAAVYFEVCCDGGAAAGVVLIVPTDGVVEVLRGVLLLLVSFDDDDVSAKAIIVCELAPNNMSNTKKNVTRRCFTKPRVRKTKTLSPCLLSVFSCRDNKFTFCVFLPIENLPMVIVSSPLNALLSRIIAALGLKAQVAQLTVRWLFLRFNVHD